MAEDFDKICRTCMVELEHAIAFTDIISIEDQKLKLGDILSTLTCFEITENDNLPQQICAPCRKSLVNAFRFQQQCYKSNKIFHILRESRGESKQNDESVLINFEDEEMENLVQQPTEKQEKVEQQNEEVQMRIINICMTTKTEEEENEDSIRASLTCMEKNCEGFTSSEVSTEHQKKHHRIYRCQNCNKTFDRSDYFIIHRRSCLNCRRCGKCFHRFSKLEIHIRNFHPNRHACDICGEPFTGLKGLSLHQESHNVIKTVCRECGKMFNGPLNLEEHMKYHSGSFVCNMCNKTFKRSDYLAEHQKIHSGEKPFACTSCGKGFRSQDSLNKHKIYHSEDSPYVCKICNERFFHKMDLTRHENTEHLFYKK